jgi:hypothetical protein
LLAATVLNGGRLPEDELADIVESRRRRLSTARIRFFLLPLRKGKEKANQLLQRAGRWNALDLALKPAPKVETLPLAAIRGDVQGPVELAKTFANGPSPANDPHPLAGQIGPRDRSWPRIRTSVGLRSVPSGDLGAWSLFRLQQGPSALDRRPLRPGSRGGRSIGSTTASTSRIVSRRCTSEERVLQPSAPPNQLAGERAMGTSSLRLHRPMDK